jgi:hypothetical protein
MESTTPKLQHINYLDVGMFLLPFPALVGCCLLHPGSCCRPPHPGIAYGRAVTRDHNNRKSSVANPASDYKLILVPNLTVYMGSGSELKFWVRNTEKIFNKHSASIANIGPYPYQG